MRIAILVGMLAAVGGAQTTVNGGRDFKGSLKASGAVSTVDFSGAGSTAPAKTGTLAARPAACTQGQFYFATDAAAGQNLSLCTTTGTPGAWSTVSGGGGGGSAAGVSYCAPSSGNGLAFTCTANPGVGAYTAGVTLALVPDVSGAGGATTLAVDGLGARPVTLADGSSNPASGDLAAGKVYLLMYDGAVFRLQVNGTNAGDISAGTLADARLSANVAMGNRTNTFTGYIDVSSGSWRPPEATVSGLPAAGSATGKVYMVTDSSGVGSCTAGGGTTRTLCRSNGASYECVGNCSTGTATNPGGSSGQLQLNSNGSFAGQAYVLSGSAFQRGVECSSGTVNYSSLTANASAQEVTIATAVTGKFRFLHMIVQESTQFASASVGTLTVSAGRPGVGTDVIPAFALKSANSPQNYWFDRPGIPIVGTGTYDLVLQFTGAGALGNGSASNFTAGALYWEVCGFGVQ
jgi:hypothetical protein